MIFIVYNIMSSLKIINTINYVNDIKDKINNIVSTYKIYSDYNFFSQNRIINYLVTIYYKRIEDYWGLVMNYDRDDDFNNNVNFDDDNDPYIHNFMKYSTARKLHTLQILYKTLLHIYIIDWCVYNNPCGPVKKLLLLKEKLENRIRWWKRYLYQTIYDIFFNCDVISLAMFERFENNNGIPIKHFISKDGGNPTRHIISRPGREDTLFFA